MTFDEVTAVGRAASHQLPGGALLRYDPSDRSVPLLRYSAPPYLAKKAPLFAGPIPQSQWGHHLGCTCACCARAGVELSVEGNGRGWP